MASSGRVERQQPTKNLKCARLGILVGGGPAPGINAVISAATIEAINQGFEVLGFYEGLRWLVADGFNAPDHAVRLEIAHVARIHFDGGSILRTSRTNLIDAGSMADGERVRPDAAKVQRVLDRLNALNIHDLITIGGDDTALSARFLVDAAGPALRVVHVPKTIDNDLPLPHDISTFGFSSARYYGAQIVKNLMQDSITTGRWYLLTVMGRSAGWLALAIGQSAAATVTLIPEEFDEKTTLQRIADVLEGAVLKRRAMGRTDGVAILAEGLAYRLGDRAELEQLLGREVSVDAAGHIQLSEIPIGTLLRRELEARFRARGEKLTMVTHVLGYELRSADPTPFDMAYCRTLGHGCIELLRGAGTDVPNGVMVSIVNGNLAPIKLVDVVDPATNRIRVRRVDVRSHQYKVARAYMIRLERSDLDDPELLAKMAGHAHLSANGFRERFVQAATRRTDPASPCGAASSESAERV